jgi:hypothetical protein
VGRGSVAAALAASGVTVAVDGQGADVSVVVIAETLKPEDRAHPATMVVLNKADLTGPDRGGPLAAAERRAVELAAATGVPVVPMIAHLAGVALDDDEMAALRAMVTTPVDMTSTDAFVGSVHPVPAQMRAHLLARLDRFGLAHAVLAVADGATPERVTEALHGLSRLDEVVQRLAAACAPVRYRRVRAAVQELRTLATQSADEELMRFVNSDAAVIGVMAAAVDVVQASGVTVDRGDDVDAHVRRAVQWRRYARGPLDPLHQRCAADISRGSLRLLARLR